MPKGHQGKHKESLHSARKQKGQHQENPPPAPGPWSRWFPQENGRWFYKARLLPNGHWDYAFTEGYPTGAQIGATYSAVVTPYLASQPIPVTVPALGTYLQPAPRQWATVAIQGADAQTQLPAQGNHPKDDDTDDKDESRVVFSKHNKTQSKGKTKSSSGQPKDKSSKELTGVVQGEKQLHVSSSKKVRGWLSDIGDLD